MAGDCWKAHKPKALGGHRFAMLVRWPKPLWAEQFLLGEGKQRVGQHPSLPFNEILVGKTGGLGFRG